MRDKIVRTVKARGINYPILLDEKNHVGGRFNGGELPTTASISRSEATVLFDPPAARPCRIAEELRRQGQWDSYLELLANRFNPARVEGLMCRNTISVGMLGEVDDCDLNPMLGMPVRNGQPLFRWDVTAEYLENSEILTGDHCLACTAGGGSSCTGAVAAAPTPAEPAR